MESDIMVDRIVYIAHSDDSFKICYTSGKCCENVCSYYTLLKLLGDNFLRINENTIVNFEYVVKCSEKTITMTNQMTFDVSSKYQKTAVNRFFKLKLERFNTGNL